MALLSFNKAILMVYYGLNLEQSEFKENDPNIQYPISQLLEISYLPIFKFSNRRIFEFV